MFGAEFRREVDEIVATEPELKECIKSFILIGNLRNQIIHNNILAYPMNYTPEEILGHAIQAVRFIELIRQIITAEQAA